MTCEMSWQTPLPLVQACIALVFTFVEPDRYSMCSPTKRQTIGPASCGWASPTASRAAATTSSPMAVSGVGVSSSPNCSRTSRARSPLQPTRSCPARSGPASTIDVPVTTSSECGLCRSKAVTVEPQ